MIHLVLFTLLADSQSDLRCSKTSGFVHQHLAPSVGIDTKSYVGSLSIFHTTTVSLQNQKNPKNQISLFLLSRSVIRRDQNKKKVSLFLLSLSLFLQLRKAQLQSFRKPNKERVVSLFLQKRYASAEDLRRPRSFQSVFFSSFRKPNKERAVSAGAVKPLVALVAEQGTGLAEKVMVDLPSEYAQSNFTVSSGSSQNRTDDPNLTFSPSDNLFFKGKLVPIESSLTEFNSDTGIEEEQAEVEAAREQSTKIASRSSLAVTSYGVFSRISPFSESVGLGAN